MHLLTCVCLSIQWFWSNFYWSEIWPWTKCREKLYFEPFSSISFGPTDGFMRLGLDFIDFWHRIWTHVLMAWALSSSIVAPNKTPFGMGFPFSALSLACLTFSCSMHVLVLAMQVGASGFIVYAILKERKKEMNRNVQDLQ